MKGVQGKDPWELTDTYLEREMNLKKYTINRFGEIPLLKSRKKAICY